MAKTIVETHVGLDTYNQVMEMAGEDIEVWEGSMLDNAIVYNDKIRFGRQKPRKYIIFEETYLNEWGSTYTVTLTDDDKRAEAFIERMREFEDDEESYPVL